jgi:hypothetical protein
MTIKNKVIAELQKIPNEKTGSLSADIIAARTERICICQ